MVEVFKTDVLDSNVAKTIIDQIHDKFSFYKANFDLEDCDKILRIICPEGNVAASEIVELVGGHGFNASVLPDEFL